LFFGKNVTQRISNMKKVASATAKKQLASIEKEGNKQVAAAQKAAPKKRLKGIGAERKAPSADALLQQFMHQTINDLVAKAS